jgi:hypothetical protein
MTDRNGEKEPKILDAEIIDDGIIVELNKKLYPHTSKVILTSELVMALAEEYGEIPDEKDTDFPGIPIVDEEDVFDSAPVGPEDEEEEEEEDGEEE